MPGRSLAGSVGAKAELGGGVQLSAPFGDWAAAANARENMTANFTAVDLQLARNQVRELIRAVTRSFNLGGQTSIAPDDGGRGIVPIEPSSAQ
jgi:hypothetical protein